MDELIMDELIKIKIGIDWDKPLEVIHTLGIWKSASPIDAAPISAP
jgi:hypothetical protein